MLILVLQSSQCSKIRVAQHWGRRGAHFSENEGVRSECKKFEENSRQMASVSTICDEYCSSFSVIHVNVDIEIKSKERISFVVVSQVRVVYAIYRRNARALKMQFSPRLTLMKGWTYVRTRTHVFSEPKLLGSMHR